MFSHRLDWNLPANRISEALAARRAVGAGVVDLTESNPTAAGLDYPAADLLAAFREPAALSTSRPPPAVESPPDRRGVLRRTGIQVRPSAS